MKKALLLGLCCGLSLTLWAQSTVTLQTDKASQIIPKEIYGQFSEHLGTCIYGGLWVGLDSDIPNTNGYRNDVLAALKDLKIPVLRWPGGCFADHYFWRDGIGPQQGRPKLVNSSWGGTIEDNSFGTHEFLNLCELLECEPYVSANLGSGTVQEMAQWVEYMTAPEGPMAELRLENGREKPWSVKYFGIGNESWGCGGQMTPEYYSDLYRRYAGFSRNYSGSRLFKVASGAGGDDYNWTKVLMERIGTRMNGVGLHYYAVSDWNNKGTATSFSDDQYYATLGTCLYIETLIQRHMAIMDEYDANKRVQLFVDEWGTWWNEEPGTIRGHLFQQNTMRDAMVAAFSLNVFHKYTERVKMANIAQIANVLQAMVLTQGDKMVLTPTYHVFRMYNVHQDATYIPVQIITNELRPQEGASAAVPAVDATASRDSQGVVHICVLNADLKEGQNVSIDLGDIKAKNITAQILTSAAITDHNTFESPSTVNVKEFEDFKLKNNTLSIQLPKMSIVAFEVK